MNMTGKELRMKPLMTLALVCSFLAIPALVSSNPALLPKHPGYPSGGEFTNDAGRPSLTVEQSLSLAAASEDSHVLQGFTNPNEVNLERLGEVDRMAKDPHDRELSIKSEASTDESSRSTDDGPMIR